MCAILKPGVFAPFNAPFSSLPDKLAAHPEGQLEAFAHSDIGMLNNVAELWRYPSADACIRWAEAWGYGLALLGQNCCSCTWHASIDHRLRSSVRRQACRLLCHTL